MLDEAEEEKVDNENISEGEFTDEFDDEFEDEEIVNDEENNLEETEEKEEKEKKMQEKTDIPKNKKKDKTVPWLDSNKNLEKGEILDYDNKAYEMLHRATTEWPCLSFDILLKDYQDYNFTNPAFQKLEKYPISTYLIGGTQTGEKDNFIYLMKMIKMHKTILDDDEEEEEEEEEEVSEEEEEEEKKKENAEMITKEIKVKYGVNRIKSLMFSPIVASWSENGDFSIYNFSESFNILQEQTSQNPLKEKKKAKDKKKNAPPSELIKTFKNKTEGWSLDWNPIKKGMLASGSCDGKIFIYNPTENLDDFKREEHPYCFHKDSVEDIQFSPTEDFAFCSCSVDMSIQICDIRVGKKDKSQIIIQKAHGSDVNVLSWSRAKSNILASGGDDGYFKLWDLRYIKKNNCLSEILWHKEPISSIAMQPNEDSVVCVGSEDNRLSLWDFAVESDEVENENYPDQLMFLHQGLEDIKEIKFHPYFYEMIVGTGSNGIHLFKPALDDVAEKYGKESSDNEENEKIHQIKEKDLDEYLAKMKIK